jgi:C4-dicarboxylate transporter, DctM subunit
LAAYFREGGKEMSPMLVGLIGMILLIAILFTGMPVAFCMGLIGCAGFLYLSGLNSGMGLVTGIAYTIFADYGLSVIPLFVLMGSFCFYADISKDIYDTVHDWLGQLRGGLAIATVGACAGFGAICGSSIACAVAMGTVAIPEMRRFKYSNALATGAVAAGGTIGSMIPPSVAFIIYGIITEQSIGKLFLAGVIPGIFQAILFVITIIIACRLNPAFGPAMPATTFKQKMYSLRNTWVVLALFILVIGGLYFGIFSPTEAAGVGAFGAFIFAIAKRRLGWKRIRESLNDTGKTTAMVFTILLGAMILNYFFAVTRLPSELANIIAGLQMNRYVILTVVLFIYLVLGCVMDTMSMTLLTVPILFPLMCGPRGLGFDPIWFGVMVVWMCEMGMITPPVGLNVFVIKGVAKDVPMSTIFKGAMPFVIADVVGVVILILVPSLATLLPGLMK